MNIFFKLLGFLLLFSNTTEGIIMGIGFMIIGYLKDIIEKLNER